MQLVTVKELFKNQEKYIGRTVEAVSYTHLDVYKRQVYMLPWKKRG